LSEVSLGVPSIVTQNGVESVIEANLTDSELEALQASATLLQESIKDIEQ
jgi:malate/lactate dehydrogenase